MRAIQYRDDGTSVEPGPNVWEQAACRGADLELFFGADTRVSARMKWAAEQEAKALCQRCPILDACLKFAIESADRWAILGGTTPAERDATTTRNCVVCGTRFAVDKPSLLRRHCGKPDCARESRRRTVSNYDRKKRADR